MLSFTAVFFLDGALWSVHGNIFKTNRLLGFDILQQPFCQSVKFRAYSSTETGGCGFACGRHAFQ